MATKIYEKYTGQFFREYENRDQAVHFCRKFPDYEIREEEVKQDASSNEAGNSVQDTSQTAQAGPEGNTQASGAQEGQEGNTTSPQQQELNLQTKVE